MCRKTNYSNILILELPIRNFEGHKLERIQFDRACPFHVTPAGIFPHGLWGSLRRTQTDAVLLILTILVAAMLLGPAFSAPSSSSLITNFGAISALSPLHTDGRYIMDSSNNTIILRGVNGFGFTDAPGGEWSGTLFSNYQQWQSSQSKVTAELDAIRSWGCNVIRVMPAVEYWVYNMGNHQQIIKELANLLTQRNMYLIYEGWCIRGYGNGAASDELPYPPYQSSTNASQVIPNKQAYVNMMLNITLTLGQYNNVIIGTWNEAGWGITNATIQAEWFNVVQQIIDGTRSAGVSNLILVQWGYGLYDNLQFPPPNPPAPPQQGGVLNWVYAYPLNGSNIVYQTHYYDGIQYPSGVGAGVGYGGLTYNQTVKGLTDCWVQYVTQNMSKPLLIGEIGANGWYSGQNLSDELNSFNTIFHVLNDWNIGYIGWIWLANGQYSLINSDTTYTPSSSGQILMNAIAATPPVRPPT